MRKIAAVLAGWLLAALSAHAQPPTEGARDSGARLAVRDE